MCLRLFTFMKDKEKKREKKESNEEMERGRDMFHILTIYERMPKKHQILPCYSLYITIIMITIPYYVKSYLSCIYLVFCNNFFSFQ